MQECVLLLFDDDFDEPDDLLALGDPSMSRLCGMGGVRLMFLQENTHVHTRTQKKPEG